VSGFVAGSGVNLDNSNFGTLARKKDRGGAAYSVSAPVIKASLPVSLAIDVSSRSQIRKQPEAGGSPCDIVAVSEAGENVMGRHASIRSSPADGQTQCRSEKAPAPRISLTAT
jgi:hypothetical protein